MAAGGEGHLALLDEGGALEDLTGDPQQGLAAGLGGETLHILAGGGPDGREGPPGRGAFGSPAEGEAPALPFQGERAFHGGTGPGLVAVFLGQIARLVPVPGGEAVEHGPEEGGPGGLARFVIGHDEGEALTGAEDGVVQTAEGGGHFNDLHGVSSPFSSAVRP